MAAAAPPASGPPSSSAVLSPPEPFICEVAANLHRLLGLSRNEHVAIWKRVLGLYQEIGRALPTSLREFCEAWFVDELLEDEIFWSLAGQAADRQLYAEAPEHVSAVYATAALLAARADRLKLEPADDSLLALAG
jgi:hypothetical protein